MIRSVYSNVTTWCMKFCEIIKIVSADNLKAIILKYFKFIIKKVPINPIAYMHT